MRHRLRVFWGNRAAESFCWSHAGLGLDVEFHVLLSGYDPAWQGGRGYVQDAAIQEGFDPGDTAVYACGASTMISAARGALVAKGLPARRFFADAFVSSN
jgi:CDP-4-dehydro-6-deoxyglucose reductase